MVHKYVVVRDLNAIFYKRNNENGLCVPYYFNDHQNLNQNKN